MTDAAETVSTLAHRAFSDAGSLTHGDIVRLAAFIVDHDEHIATERARSSQTADKPTPVATPVPQLTGGQLTQRLVTTAAVEHEPNTDPDPRA